VDTGVKISGVAHVVLVGVAMFGAPLFSADTGKTIQISEVSLISSEEFAALASGNISQPVPKPEAVVPVDSSTQPTESDPAPDIELDPVAPSTPSEVINAFEPQVTESAPPKPAKTISNAVVETPTEPVKPLPVAKPSVIEVPSPQEPPKPEPDQPSAPKESTTEIVTEADKEESKLAPIRSSRPRSRPKNLKKEDAPKPEVAIEPAPDPIEDAIAMAIAEDLAKAAAEAASQPAVIEGPPMTGSETSGLVFAIQQCWNVPVGLENDASNVITMGIKLTRDGRLEEEPRRISPVSGSAAGILQAYEAARRALIRCQPYDLPIEKYETWREIEIVFNPQQMVLR